MINGKNKTVEALKRDATISNRLILSCPSRLVISLADRYVSEEDVLARNKDVRCTSGTYFVKYVPKGSATYMKGCNFLIGNDLVGFYLRVSGSTHFEKLAAIFPEIDWMIKHTNYDPMLFRVAQLHPCMMITFNVNWAEYFEKILADMTRRGIDPVEHKPFVTFKCSASVPTVEIDPERYRPTRAEYGDKILAAEKLANI